ncbi:hypothetical protein ABW19_dt0201049 [Dactylella cylindrospora]|nr:hypothetical protein ABW19_dt0201049 [Dactylella cylindrospora]
MLCCPCNVAPTLFAECSFPAYIFVFSMVPNHASLFSSTFVFNMSTSILRRSAPRILKSTKSPSRRVYSSKSPKPLDYAFAFDIDGVLLRGRTPLPGATKALLTLQKHHVPFILLTNGGGKHESERVEELSHLLDVPITEDMFIQSHTPFKGLVGKYNSILAIGGEEIGEGEGWKDGNTGRKGEGGIREVAESTTNGIEVPGQGKWQNNGQPEVWWSNNDLWWQGEYHLPRLGQGGFRAAVEGVWHKITGGEELKAKTIGKPFKETYQYAEGVLNKLLREDLGEGGKVRTVYMVGDNPRSDIMGANGYGWYSLLVESGVFNRDREGGEKALIGDMQPKKILRDVHEAVEFGMQRGGKD